MRPLYIKEAHCGTDCYAEFCEFRAIFTWTEWIEDWRWFLISNSNVEVKKSGQYFEHEAVNKLLPFIYKFVSFLEMFINVCVLLFI
jgi:hypothetical protein